MKVYLCGQKYFGREVLRLLLDRPGVEVVGVSVPLSTADGREDRTAELARLHELPRMPPGELRATNLPRGTDLIVCAHSHDYLGRATRNRAKLGAIGYHPSLLPLHRGRDAVRWTIRDRDRVAGGTVFWLSDNVDAGPVAAREWCFVRPDDDAETLYRRELQPMGVRLIARALDDLDAGRMVRVAQDRHCGSWEPSMDAPPLFRPELPMLGYSSAGYVTVVEDDRGLGPIPAEACGKPASWAADATRGPIEPRSWRARA